MFIFWTEECVKSADIVSSQSFNSTGLEGPTLEPASSMVVSTLVVLVVWLVASWVARVSVPLVAGVGPWSSAGWSRENFQPALVWSCSLSVGIC